MVPDVLDFKSTFVYGWVDKWLQTRQAERCGLFLVNTGPRTVLVQSPMVRSDAWRTSARMCDNSDTNSAFVTTMTSTVRYSRSQLLSVDRYATRDTRSRLVRLCKSSSST